MKKMRFVSIMFFLVLIASGCVQQPIEGNLTKEQQANRNQESARIHTELAAEYYYRGQMRVAIEEVDKALKAIPNYAPAYNVLGLVNMSLNENQQARNNFKKALRYTPTDPEINNNYGWFLCERFPDQMDDAIDHFMTALKDPLYDTPERSYANAGICELRRDNRTEALAFFRHALSIKSNFPTAVYGLIEVDFKNGDLTSAKSKLTTFMQHSRPTPESLWLAVQIEGALGDHLAEESYRFQLLKHFPDSKEAIALRKGRLK
ncbi:MAG: type IV pilus biogenesis/stability protein PilW [Nitrosomonas sp.]|nr:type IV pilus biogenesis/stability protein PilW [Nitrosomonas sp.]